jgi:hypothetical protein
MCLGGGTKTSEQPVKTMLDMSSSPTDLDGITRLRTSQISKYEIRVNNKNSEDCEREENTA